MTNYEPSAPSSSFEMHPWWQDFSPKVLMKSKGSTVYNGAFQRGKRDMTL